MGASPTRNYNTCLVIFIAFSIGQGKDKKKKSNKSLTWPNKISRPDEVKGVVRRIERGHVRDKSPRAFSALLRTLALILSETPTIGILNKEVHNFTFI